MGGHVGKCFSLYYVCYNSILFKNLYKSFESIVESAFRIHSLAKQHLTQHLALTLELQVSIWCGT